MPGIDDQIAAAEALRAELQTQYADLYTAKQHAPPSPSKQHTHRIAHSYLVEAKHAFDAAVSESKKPGVAAIILRRNVSSAGLQNRVSAASLIADAHQKLLSAEAVFAKAKARATA